MSFTARTAVRAETADPRTAHRTPKRSGPGPLHSIHNRLFFTIHDSPRQRLNTCRAQTQDRRGEVTYGTITRLHAKRTVWGRAVTLHRIFHSAQREGGPVVHVLPKPFKPACYRLLVIWTRCLIKPQPHSTRRRPKSRGAFCSGREWLPPYDWNRTRKLRARYSRSMAMYSSQRALAHAPALS
jgi:hypothetical protein